MIALFFGILYMGRSLSQEARLAVWALFGLGYPSALLPFAFNAVSKVVAFVVTLSLFLPQQGRNSTPEPTDSVSLGDLGHRGRGRT